MLQGPPHRALMRQQVQNNAVKCFLTALFICVLLYCVFFSAGRTSLVERCTSCASSTSSPLSPAPFSWATPGSGFCWDQQSFSVLVIVVFWMERSVSFWLYNSLAHLRKDWSSIIRHTGDPWTLCANCLSSVWQVTAGEVPLLLASPIVRQTALSDPFQCLGPGVQSDSVLGGSLLLPPAASHRNCHADSHVLHQQGCHNMRVTDHHMSYSALSLSLCVS